MRILGVDPGLNITGYGLLEKDGDEIRIVEAGIVKTKMSDTMAERLREIGREFGTIIDQLKPDLIAVEELYSHYNHPKTAIIMGHARGIIFLKAAEAFLPVIPYASTKVKNALTGNGRATKNQVQKMICVSLNLRAMPEPPDVADALAVALCHLRSVDQTEAVRL